MTLIPFAEVIKKGKENISPFDAVSANDIYTFSYTSGTVGKQNN